MEPIDLETSARNTTTPKRNSAQLHAMRLGHIASIKTLVAERSSICRKDGTKISIYNNWENTKGNTRNKTSESIETYGILINYLLIWGAIYRTKKWVFTAFVTKRQSICTWHAKDTWIFSQSTILSTKTDNNKFDNNERIFRVARFCRETINLTRTTKCFLQSTKVWKILTIIRAEHPSKLL